MKALSFAHQQFDLTGDLVFDLPYICSQSLDAEIPGLENVTILAGTDGIGRDWWTLLWYSTMQSLVLSVIVAVSSVVIGTIYGSIAGSRAGKMSDIILMIA